MDNFTIKMSELAAEKFLELLQDQDMTVADVHLRLWVAGGGCSGLTYGMAIDHELPEETDHVTLIDSNINVVVDDLSAKYVNGSTIDWDDNVLGGGFKVNNPNISKGCGCGSSFAVEGEEIPDGSCQGCSKNI